MRVLLIQTLSIEGASHEKVFPIGIVILASSLRGKYEVNLLDMNIEPDPFGAVKSRLLDFRPDVVGLSLRNIDSLANKTNSLIPPFLTTAKLVASVMPQSWLIAGGPAFSLFPERLMREAPEIHYGLVGEAEKSLPLLLSSLENPPQIGGLCRRSQTCVKICFPSQHVDMGQYKRPNRDLLHPSLYAGINSYVPAIGIETKRGCPFHCAYCVYPSLQGKKLRCRPPRDVVDELEFLHKEYGIARFHFTDPILNYPVNQFEDISLEIIRRKLKLKWDGFIREDNFNEKNATLFEKAGCECFSFSPDGLCQESLDVLDKRLTESDILKAAKIAARTDVVSVYHFMVNVPGETKESCDKGIRFLERIYDLHYNKKNLGTMILNNIRILPGTRIEALARARGIIRPDTDLLYPTYYNPEPFDAFRYNLEALHLSRNVFMWQEVGTTI